MQLMYILYTLADVYIIYISCIRMDRSHSLRWEVDLYGSCSRRLLNGTIL